jgi:hypothetical protein
LRDAAVGALVCAVLLFAYDLVLRRHSLLPSVTLYEIATGVVPQWGRSDNHSISPGAGKSVPTRDIGRFHRSGSSLPIADPENAWPKITLQSLGSVAVGEE